MSDPFGPGDRLFWVFWVITLPITCFTLTIIYADDIRKAYIWKPMSHKSLQDAINKGEAVTADAAARLAHAAERVIDKFSSDGDPEIETDPVASAVRLVDARGSNGRRARVRVTTKSGPGGPTFYRLADVSQPESPPALFNTLEYGAASAFLARCNNFGPERANQIGTAEMFSRPVSGLNVAAPGCPTILLEQRNDELQPKAWRLQQLGWVGAFKTIVGYQRPRDA
ncbi:hypothetical protein HMPREF1624_07223 [Sporothrix schenckii ATCC 58251]|uniref:Uncharacterized protein n=1 Tax=Sporothrix schenckii (strain ATCC 58251 / de Perez 2211183) TaxID=1391915 RepID=U7PKY5_SPOS1|nr:hypothetical protein HMPREF1624_07223 [Sporothrix schenckii ATCC 58251]